MELAGSNSGKSTATVLVQQYGDIDWNTIATILPGAETTIHPNGGAETEIKFKVINRPFQAASDNGSGFDIHFEDVWVEVREGSEHARAPRRLTLRFRGLPVCGARQVDPWR